MATQRVIHEDTPPNPVNPSICESFQAQLGAQVTFGGVIGTQTITQVGNVWPFTVLSPMTVPNTQTIRIKSSGLTVGQTYPYSVSQACIEGIQKGVTIIT
jgi:H+/gluconate symporter-like permease